jgi:tripartite-type tricarboxylate transporter receptor subunit TctC
MKTLIYLFLLVATSVSANTITVTIGYGPGGGTDLIVRDLLAEAEKVSDIKFIVENKPGAGGVIALRSYFEEPKPQALLGVSGGQILFEPLANPENNFLNQLKMVGPVLISPLVLVTAPQSKIQKVKDLFDTSISKQKINISTAGAANEALVNSIKKHSCHDIEIIRYKSSADAYFALISGTVDLQSVDYGFSKSKNLKSIVMSSKKSIDNVPQLTSYIKNAVIFNFFGIAAAKSYDTTTVERAITAGLTPSKKQYFKNEGYTVDTNIRADFISREVLPLYEKMK